MARSTRMFDFSASVKKLCIDVVERVPEFHHIEMEQIAVTFAQARRSVSHGLQAKLTPMRFEKGELTTYRSGETWTVNRLFDNEREILYILTFYLPRFLNHCFREKMITIFHELYHVSPEFDGDIRRLEGHYHVHSHSQNEYDRHMGVLVDKYLAMNPPKELSQFLNNTFKELNKQYGGVVGLQLPIPKLIRVNERSA